MGIQRSAQPVVLVTMSANLIGTPTIATLSPEYQVVALTPQPPAQPLREVDWIVCELTRAQSITEGLAAVRLRHGDHLAGVLHLAAYAEFSGEPRPLPQALVVDGTRWLLQGLQQFSVEQFLFAGSLFVMQPVTDPHAVLTETSLTAAMWDYPQWQLAAESAMQHNSGKIPTVMLRIAYVYDEDCHAPLLAHFLHRMYEQQLGSHVFPGELMHGQAFLHLDDLSTCFRTILARRHALGAHELFLIAEPDIVTYGELAEIAGPLLHEHGAVLLPIPKTLAKVGAWVQQHISGEREDPLTAPWAVNFADLNYPVAINHARARLGWSPQHSLRATLPEVVRRLQQDPKRWYQLNGLLADE